jgi:hypothetical protein
VAGMVFNGDCDEKGRFIVDAKSREAVRKGLFQDAGLTPRAYSKDDAPEGGARISIDLSVDTIAAIMQNMADNRAKHE